MPSKEWFEHNPKISAYLPPDLHDKLSEWAKERHISKSKAITLILQEHFGISDINVIPVGQASSRRIDELEAKFEVLEQQLEWIAQMMRGEAAS